MGHKINITAKLKEDESNDMNIQFMCNDSPNRFGLNLRVSTIDEDSDQYIIEALDALIRYAREKCACGDTE